MLISNIDKLIRRRFRISIYHAISLIVTCSILVGCSSFDPGGYLEDGAFVAASFFGDWIYFIYVYLFWIYAVVFGLLAIGRGSDTIIRHIVLTGAMYATFHWSPAPALACIFTYYVGMPLLYIPKVSRKVIEKGVLKAGTTLTYLYLCIMEWQTKDTSEWLPDLAIWGICAFLFAFFMSMELIDRCPNCGHYALSWKGTTDRFYKAEEHFSSLSADGSDQDGTSGASVELKNNKHMRCGHCLHTN